MPMVACNSEVACALSSLVHMLPTLECASCPFSQLAILCQSVTWQSRNISVNVIIRKSCDGLVTLSVVRLDTLSNLSRPMAGWSLELDAYIRDVSKVLSGLVVG